MERGERERERERERRERGERTAFACPLTHLLSQSCIRAKEEEKA